jgi:hypothetical protein
MKKTCIEMDDSRAFRVCRDFQLAARQLKNMESLEMSSVQVL